MVLRIVFALSLCFAIVSAQRPGWRGINQLVVFGDSYTTTGFNTSLAQPSVSNPLGNPAYPGWTSSNGPNWVDYLTVKFNKTKLRTLNLAYGGATVDSALVTPYLPTVLSLKDQITEEFLPLYGNRDNKLFRWDSKSTLFASFIGINDVGNTWYKSDSSQTYAKIFEEYQDLLEKLYKSNARNFLFINVPPVDRAPLTVSSGPEAQAAEKKDIAAWNHNVTTLANDFKKKHAKASVFVYDANKLFSQVLDRPCAYAETCGYKNTTDYCPAYENGTPSPSTLVESCVYPAEDYFWLNSLHPTSRMHYVLAQEVARSLT